ncbi:MAG: hypothetical protein NVSMB17_01880 [Candidatus Dormibacteria bacterium]
MPDFSLTRLFSWLLMGTAMSLLIFAGSNAAFDVTSQGELASAWDHAHQGRATAVAVPPTTLNSEPLTSVVIQRPRLAVGQPLAKLLVPAADNWKGIVLEGTDDRVLSGGPGHLVGTAYPGEADNMVISNHNTYSMQFANLKVGDQFIVDADYGHFVYRISGFKTVPANDRVVTGHTNRPMLTFTTCYPLWAGAFARERYVITAEQVSG